MKRKPLSKSEIKNLNQELLPFGIEFHKKERIDFIDEQYYLKDNYIIAFLYEGKIVPTLKFMLKNPEITLPEIIVDMGAVKFVVSGADIMRPGIVQIDEQVNEHNLVVIKDQNHKKPLAIGISLFDKNTLESLKEGKTIKNIHYIGDDIWNFQV